MKLLSYSLIKQTETPNLLVGNDPYILALLRGLNVCRRPGVPPGTYLESAGSLEAEGG